MDLVRIPTYRPGQYLGTSRARVRAGTCYVQETAYEAGARLPDHAHAFAHLCFVLAGCYRERIRGRWLERRRSDLMFYPPETVHAELHGAPGRHLIVELDPALLASVQEDLIRSSHGIPMRSTFALEIARRIHGEIRRGDQFSALAIEGMVLELMVEVLREGRAGASDRPSWLTLVLDRLHTDLGQSPTLEELAREARVHPAHLTRAFRKRMGCTVGEYRRKLCLERACSLLAGTELPLADVAIDAGFSDQSHMTRTLRAHVGTTPGRYRSLARERSTPR